MMKNSGSWWMTFLAMCFVIPIMEGCSAKARDEEIKADITLKAKDDVNFSDVQFFVRNGTVKLTGSCPTPRSRELVIQKLSTIHVIDSVEDHLVVAPVTLGRTFTLKQQVDSVLAKYPTVVAAVSDTSIMLIGDIQRAELQELLFATKKLLPNVSTARLITND